MLQQMTDGSVVFKRTPVNMSSKHSETCALHIDTTNNIYWERYPKITNEALTLQKALTAFPVNVKGGQLPHMRKHYEIEPVKSRSLLASLWAPVKAWL